MKNYLKHIDENNCLENMLVNEPTIGSYSRNVSDISNQEFLKNKFFTTFSGFHSNSEYFENTLSSIYILKKIDFSLLNSVDVKVREQVISFVFRFKEIIINNQKILPSIDMLPPLIMNIIDDGTVLLEWGFKDFRFGFSFELKPEDSSWYFVSNEKFQNTTSSRKIIEDEYEEILSSILSFVCSNT